MKTKVKSEKTFYEWYMSAGFIFREGGGVRESTAGILIVGKGQ